MSTPCPYTVTDIQRTDYIGNSLNFINTNFRNLQTGVCANYSSIEQVNEDISELRNRIEELATYLPGVAKAWVSFDATRDVDGNPSATFGRRFIRSSYNIQLENGVQKNSANSLGTDFYFRVNFKEGLFTSSNYGIIVTSSRADINNQYTWAQPRNLTRRFADIYIHGGTTPYIPTLVNPTHVSVVIY